MTCPYLKEVSMVFCRAYPVKKLVPLDRSPPRAAAKARPSRPARPSRGGGAQLARDRGRGRHPGGRGPCLSGPEGRQP